MTNRSFFLFFYRSADDIYHDSINEDQEKLSDVSLDFFTNPARSPAKQPFTALFYDDGLLAR